MLWATTICMRRGQVSRQWRDQLHIPRKCVAEQTDRMTDGADEEAAVAAAAGDAAAAFAARPPLLAVSPDEDRDTRLVLYNPT